MAGALIAVSLGLVNSALAGISAQFVQKCHTLPAHGRATALQKTRTTGLHFWARFAAPDVEPAFTNVNKVGPKMWPAKRPWIQDLENSSGAFFLAALLACFVACSLHVHRRQRFVVCLFTYGLCHAGVMSKRERYAMHMCAEHTRCCCL